MIKVKHYTYRVTWSEDDQEYIGLCAEFPSLSFLSKTQSAALTGIVDLVNGVVKDMKKQGEVIPEPLATRTFSGKFQIRTTPDVHRMLSMRATELGISLNRYVNSKLALSE